MEIIFFMIAFVAGIAVVGVFLVDPMIQRHRAPAIAACEAKGGVYIPQSKSKDLCLKKDAVIE